MLPSDDVNTADYEVSYTDSSLGYKAAHGMQIKRKSTGTVLYVKIWGTILCSVACCFCPFTIPFLGSIKKYLCLFTDGI